MRETYMGQCKTRTEPPGHSDEQQIQGPHSGPSFCRSYHQDGSSSSQSDACILPILQDSDPTLSPPYLLYRSEPRLFRPTPPTFSGEWGRRQWQNLILSAKGILGTHWIPPGFSNMLNESLSLTSHPPCPSLLLARRPPTMSKVEG